MLLLLIYTVVRLELDVSTPLEVGSLLLVGGTAAAAIASSIFAFRALQRHRRTLVELNRSERTFQGILTIAADAIISVDQDQRIVHYNHGAEAMFGYSAAEMIGQPLDQLLPARHRGSHGKHVREFGKGPEVARRMGERRQIYGLRRDGREFAAEASISKLDVEGGRLYNVVLRDITQRLRAEGAQRFLAEASNDLNASLDYEQTLVAAVHAAVPYLCDCAVLDVVEPSGEVHRVTSVHEDTHRTRLLRTLAGRSAVPSDAPFPAATAMSTGKSLPMRHPGPTAAGTGIVGDLGLTVSITVPMRARGRVFGALTLCATEPGRRCDEEDVALAENLTERVAAAIDNAVLFRDEQRASRMRDELMGVVSHDLRNPLSAIRMCARVLAEHEPATANERHEVAGAILDSVVAMERLIQDLLDAATIESGHLRITTELASMNAVVLRALAMVRDLATERGVALFEELDPALPKLDIDTIRMEQVVANLLGNAVKFTDRGGRVTVSTSRVVTGVRVAVADTGIGIPADALPHIFDRFWHARRTSRTAGSGLGLAIAKGIVSAHGGALEVESTPGSGSTFSFVIPVPSPGTGVEEGT